MSHFHHLESRATRMSCSEEPHARHSEEPHAVILRSRGDEESRTLCELRGSADRRPDALDSSLPQNDIGLRFYGYGDRPGNLYRRKTAIQWQRRPMPVILRSRGDEESRTLCELRGSADRRPKALDSSLPQNDIGLRFYGYGDRPGNLYRRKNNHSMAEVRPRRRSVPPC